MRRAPGDVPGAASPRVTALPTVDVLETSRSGRDKLIIALVDVVTESDCANILFIALIAQWAVERLVRLLGQELGAIDAMATCGVNLIIFIINRTGVLIILGPFFLGTIGR